MEKRTTLREIARVANVHVTTVSLALRHHPSIPVTTRERIKAIAERMHYHPDAALASLMAYRQSLKTSYEATPIAYLTGDRTRDQWKKTPTLLRIYEGARDRAEALGYGLEEFWIHEPGVTPKRLSQLLVARGIHAILIAPWVHPIAHLDLDWRRFHCVQVGHSLLDPAFHAVENSHYQGMQLAMRSLRSKGYRRIGFASRQWEDDRLNHLYKAAYLVEQEHHPALDRLPAFIPDVWDKKMFMTWFERHRPEVVISADLEIYSWLKGMNLNIPKKVGYVNLDCSQEGVAHSGIRQMHHEIGKTAMDLLVGIIHRHEPGVPDFPHRTQVMSQWVDGKTTR